MKKTLYSSIIIAGALMAGCTDFDTPHEEQYGAGPSIEIAATVTGDSTFTLTLTPAAGTQFYSYLVDAADEPGEPSAADLLKGGYKGVAQGVLKYADNATFTNTMRDTAGKPLCLPNVVYQIYAVAASDKGICGKVATYTVTTSDEGIPTVVKAVGDSESRTVSVAFSEAVTRTDAAEFTAVLYKEWGSPELLTEDEDYTVAVKGNTVTFTAPKSPAGAILFYSWNEGAFADATGNVCKAFQSGITQQGKLVGALVQNDQEPFDIADSLFVSPAQDALVKDWEAFEGVIKLPFDVYRNDKDLKGGEIVVVYSNAASETAYKLGASDWKANAADSTVTFTLPAEPKEYDKITVTIVEGAFTDVYGNPCNAFDGGEVAWTFFNLTMNKVVGSYQGVYQSAYDGKVYYLNEEGKNIGIETPAGAAEDSIVISNVMSTGSEVGGHVDLEKGKLYMNTYEVVGTTPKDEEDPTAGDYLIITVSVADLGAEEVEFNITNKAITSDDLGFVVVDVTAAGLDLVGWYDKAAVTQLKKITAGGASAARASVASVKGDIKPLSKPIRLTGKLK